MVAIPFKACVSYARQIDRNRGSWTANESVSIQAERIGDLGQTKPQHRSGDLAKGWSKGPNSRRQIRESSTWIPNVVRIPVQ